MADRIARKMRPTFIVLAGLSFPAFMLTYGYMVVDALKTWPWWASVIMVFSHFMAVLGMSSLHDRQQERQ